MQASLEPASPPRIAGLPLLGNVAQFVRAPLDFLEQAAKRGGDLVCLSFPTGDAYLLSTPSLVEAVLVTHYRSFVKDRFLRGAKRIFGEGLLTSEGEFWRAQRRLIQPAFHRDRLHAFATQTVKSAERMVAAWSAGDVRNVHRDLLAATLEVVVRALFDADVGPSAARIGEDVDALTAWQADPLRWLLPGVAQIALPSNFRAERAIRRLDGLIASLLNERPRSGAEHENLLSRLLAARDDDGHAMSAKQVRDEVMTFLLAGHETTAAAVSWSLHLLSQHPDVDARVHEELVDVLGQARPDADDIPKLSSVESVVREALRLYPPVWVLGREAAVSCRLGGFTIPCGANVWMSPYVIHRDPRFFEEPHAFRPERWSDGSSKRIPKFAYFPFGAGPRQCIGNVFAMSEATLMLAIILQKFRLVAPRGAAAVPHPTITLRPRHGLEMRIESRNGRRKTA